MGSKHLTRATMESKLTGLLLNTVLLASVIAAVLFSSIMVIHIIKLWRDVVTP